MNINPSGSLDTNEVAKAVLLHQNPPLPDLGASPVELLFSLSLNDHLPNPVKFCQEWLELADLCKKAVNQCFTNTTKHVHNRHLNPLKVGEPVAIQNQNRHHPQHWNNTGMIVEALPHKQYRVLVDGSWWTTLWNRCFLRKIFKDTRNMNLNNSFPDLNKASDINDPLTLAVVPPESPHPIHLEQNLMMGLTSESDPFVLDECCSDLRTLSLDEKDTEL